MISAVSLCRVQFEKSPRLKGRRESSLTGVPDLK
jgi:hypothetical protein